MLFLRCMLSISLRRKCKNVHANLGCGHSCGIWRLSTATTKKFLSEVTYPFQSSLRNVAGKLYVGVMTLEKHIFFLDLGNLKHQQLLSLSY